MPELVCELIVSLDGFDTHANQQGVHANLLRFFREMGIGGFEWETAPDVGEAARVLAPGGLLVARHGKGRYVYTGLSFFRQLPAGVPGDAIPPPPLLSGEYPTI